MVVRMSKAVTNNSPKTKSPTERPNHSKTELVYDIRAFILKVSFNIGNYPYSLAQSSEKCNENLRKTIFSCKVKNEGHNIII